MRTDGSSVYHVLYATTLASAPVSVATAATLVRFLLMALPLYKSIGCAWRRKGNRVTLKISINTGALSVTFGPLAFMRMHNRCVTIPQCDRSSGAWHGKLALISAVSQSLEGCHSDRHSCAPQQSICSSAPLSVLPKSYTSQDLVLFVVSAESVVCALCLLQCVTTDYPEPGLHLTGTLSQYFLLTTV